MSSGEDFAFSGPTHLMMKRGGASSPTKMFDIDWNNHEHRRCVTACLVKGTYVLERDQTKHRTGTAAALAPAWWESFHFRLNAVLEFKDARNWFIQGAIFENVCPLRRHPSAPRYIVAFRGTMPKDPTFLGDARLNLRIMLNMQHCSCHFVSARKQVRQLLDSISSGGSAGAVWLAGHSLGASIALDVGREMMIERGCNLPTFLFNPPHVSLAPAADMLRMPEQAKRDLYGVSYFVKDALGKTILQPQMKHMEDRFAKLCSWVPELYVHQRDIICKGFIDYFEQRQQLQKRFPSKARSAATLAYRDMLHWSAMSGPDSDHKKHHRQHLLPTARLWKNSSFGSNAHELQQWWQPKLVLSCNLYSWP